MKVKLKDKSSNLPNCWKQCGVSKEEWDKLQEGKEIDVNYRKLDNGKIYNAVYSQLGSYQNSDKYMVPEDHFF